MKRLLDGERVDFKGRWSSYDGAQLLPPPERRPPILVAAKGERMLRLTARHADAWNTAWFGGLDAVARQRLADLDAACDEVGRPPREIRRTIGIRLHEPGLRGDDTKGTDADAEGLADILAELDEAGFDDTIIWSLAKSHAAIERIGEARRIHLARDRTPAR